MASSGKSQFKYAGTASAWQNTAAAPSRRIRRTSAAEAPMASPSAPTCVVTATRSRVFKNSAISDSMLFVVRVVIRLYLPECSLYPRRPFHDGVRLEVQFRCALEARLGPHGGLDATGRALQSLVRGHLVPPGKHAVEHRRVGEVGANPDAGHRNEALDARVRERGDLLAGDLLELRLYLARAPAHNSTNSSRQSRIESSS